VPQTAPATSPALDFYVTAVTTVHEGAAVSIAAGPVDVLVLVHIDEDGNAHVVPGSSFPASPAAERWLADDAYWLGEIASLAYGEACEDRRSWLKHGDAP
jgi:hypothetical protein